MSTVTLQDYCTRLDAAAQKLASTAARKAFLVRQQQKWIGDYAVFQSKAANDRLPAGNTMSAQDFLDTIFEIGSRIDRVNSLDALVSA